MESEAFNLRQENERLRAEIARLQAAQESQRQFETTLRESEERFRSLCDSAPVMIWQSDTSKLCTFFNRSWLTFTGRSMEQELGNGWIEGVHPEDSDVCGNTYVAHFDARQEFQMEYRLRRHDGVYRWVLDTGVPCFAADQTFTGYIGSCIDITERKEAEQMLARHNSALEEAISEIHHRVKNNLQTVIALLELQMPERVASVPIANLEDSLVQIKSIALVHDLLSHRTPPGQVDVRQVLENLIRLRSESHPVRSLQITLSADSLLLPVREATALTLITNELISHALPQGDSARRNVSKRRKNPPGKGSKDVTISVTLLQHEEQVSLTIITPDPADAGAGASSSLDTGSGLDLVRNLVDNDLQGTLAVDRVDARSPAADAAASESADSRRRRVQVRFGAGREAFA